MAELTAGRLAAVLDVTEPEPLPAGHPLLALPNAFVTPHVAGAMGNELVRLSELAVTEVERFVGRRAAAAPGDRRGPRPHRVTRAARDPSRALLGDAAGAVRRRGGAARGRVRAGARSSGVATCTCRPATPRPPARARAASDGGRRRRSRRTARTCSRPATADAAESRRGARHRGRARRAERPGVGRVRRSSRAPPRTRALVDGLRGVRARRRGARGLTVGLEYHGGTADRDASPARSRCSTRSARRTSRPTGSRRTGVARPRRRPTRPRSTALGARLSHLHVYEWAGPEDRRPLADGRRTLARGARRGRGARRRPRRVPRVRGRRRSRRRSAATPPTLRAWLAGP